jgi:hypothetical protein
MLACYRLSLLAITNNWIDLLFFSFHLLRFTPHNLLKFRINLIPNPLDIWEDTLGGGSVVCISIYLDVYNTIQHGDTPILCAGSEPQNQTSKPTPLRLRFIVLAILFSIYVIVYLTTLTVAQIIQYRKTKWLMNNCKRWRTKRSWPTIRYYPGICRDWLRNDTKKTSVKLAGLRAEIWIRDPPKRRQDYSPHYCEVRLALLLSLLCLFILWHVDPLLGNDSKTNN